MSNDFNEHRAKYAPLVNNSTISFVVKSIGASRLLASTDQHLNDIPLNRWDAMVGILPLADRFENVGVTPSPASYVCVAKEAARQWLGLPSHGRESSMLGVPGKWTVAGGNTGPLVTQRFESAPRKVSGYGQPATMRVSVRFDDSCGNGYQTFAITAEVKATRKCRDPWLAGGCLHDEITRVFPEFGPLIQWHLTSAGPRSTAIQNALYLAGNRDCWGRAPGDPCRYASTLQFDGVPVRQRVKESFWQWLLDGREAGVQFGAIGVPYAGKSERVFNPKFTLVARDDSGDHEPFTSRWENCPFDDQVEADEFAEAMNTCSVEFSKLPVAWSEGKARELEAARRAAKWPDATDAELSVPREELRAVLEARESGVRAQFREAMESAGFTWREAKT